MAGPHCQRLYVMVPQIYILPHPSNLSVLSTPTNTASCAGPVSLSIRVLTDIYVSPSPKSIRSFYAHQHCILCRSCDSICPSSDRFFRFPLLTLTPLTATPLSLFVLVGGVGFFTWYFLHTSDSATPMYLSILVGGVVINTWYPSLTPDSSVYIRPGGEGWF